MHQPKADWRTVAALLAVFTAFFLLLAHFAHATEAPGCGDQRYRPRLSQCCPKIAAGEDLPPKCTLAVRDGFLPGCCFVPTPEPSVPCDVSPQGCPWAAA